MYSLLPTVFLGSVKLLIWAHRTVRHLRPQGSLLHPSVILHLTTQTPSVPTCYTMILLFNTNPQFSQRAITLGTCSLLHHGALALNQLLPFLWGFANLANSSKGSHTRMPPNQSNFLPCSEQLKTLIQPKMKTGSQVRKIVHTVHFPKQVTSLG